jgi:hypothetical protein
MKLKSQNIIDNSKFLRVNVIFNRMREKSGGKRKKIVCGKPCHLNDTCHLIKKK